MIQGKTVEGRIVLTGGAGRLGRVLRRGLAGHLDELASSDIVEPDDLVANERFTLCDLSDADATSALLEGARAIVHFGGISNQRPFPELVQGNIVATHNVFEAARRHDVRRVILASSNHAVGFYPTDVQLDADVAYRPDSLYGASKAFGELQGRLYHDRYGIEVACLRIGSCIERPKKPRHIATWLSHGDLVRLVLACLQAPRFGFEILYGVSNNSQSWWVNQVGPIAYQPADSADLYAGQIEAFDETEPQWQGGAACFRELPDT